MHGERGWRSVIWFAWDKVFINSTLSIIHLATNWGRTADTTVRIEAVSEFKIQIPWQKIEHQVFSDELISYCRTVRNSIYSDFGTINRTMPSKFQFQRLLGLKLLHKIAQIKIFDTVGPFDIVNFEKYWHADFFRKSQMLVLLKCSNVKWSHCQ